MTVTFPDHPVWTTVLNGIIIVSAVTILSVLAFWYVIRFIPHRRQPQYTPFVNAVYEVVGILYAVLAAFIVIVVWESYEAASHQVQVESGTVATLFEQSHSFPEVEGHKMREELKVYLRTVVYDEWDELAAGSPAKSAVDSYGRIWDTYMAYAPVTKAQQVVYTKSVEELSQLGEARRLRIVLSRSKLPTPMWILLVAGGLLTIWFTLFLWTPFIRRQAVLIAAVGALIGFIFFLIDSLQLPFTGAVRITPRPLSVLYEKQVAIGKEEAKDGAGTSGTHETNITPHEEDTPKTGGSETAPHGDTPESDGTGAAPSEEAPDSGEASSTPHAMAPLRISAQRLLAADRPLPSPSTQHRSTT